MSQRDDPLRMRFVMGVGVALALMVALGGVLAAVGTSADRPEGAAERWLAAVADTTRAGVSADATDRANAIGPLALADPLLPAIDTDGERAFTDLEVGDAAVAGTIARVPYRLRQFVASGSEPVLAGTIVLENTSAGWRVVGLEDRAAGERVPSEGGSPPTEAPIGMWLGAAAIGTLLCALASAAVRAAGREAEALAH